MRYQNSDNKSDDSEQARKRQAIQKFNIVKHDELKDKLPDLQDRVLLVDFDETLWLHNSTETYLNFVHPEWMAKAILYVTMLQRPIVRRLWPQFWAGEKDWMRVGAVSLLMPWNLSNWRRHARAFSLGRQHQNEELINILKSCNANRVIVISNGFQPVLKPLLDSIDLPVEATLAPSLIKGLLWRRLGKCTHAEAMLSAEELDNACFITDHFIDDDLLSRVGYGVLCKWPDAVFNSKK